VVSFGLPILETLLSISRRLISGRPIFTSIASTFTTSCCRWLFPSPGSNRSLRRLRRLRHAQPFLALATGSTLGLVLAVVGTGVGLGSASELPGVWRVAARGATHHRSAANRDQQSFRAPRHRGTQSGPRLRATAQRSGRRVQQQRFSMPSNCTCDRFPGIEPSSAKRPATFTGASSLTWPQFPGQPSWKLTLDLVTTSKQPRGSLVVYRIYSRRDLQTRCQPPDLRIPAILADALERVLTAPDALVPAAQFDSPLRAANL